MEFGRERPSRRIERPTRKIEQVRPPLEPPGDRSIDNEIILSKPLLGEMREKPRLDLKGLAVDVGPLANEKKVLDKALSVIEGMEPPLTIERVNEETKDLAITFHEIGEGEDSVIALTCPLEPGGATVYDAASVAITALHGDIDAALLQGVHAELKSDNSLAAGAARCVIGGFLIHMMPTSVIGKTVTMLSDAVQGMREKAEQKELEAAKDFTQTQAIAEWLRHREITKDAPLTYEPMEPLDDHVGLYAPPTELYEKSTELPDESIDLPGFDDGPSFGL
ncbi:MULTISPECIES: hypothetical protein [unclassified Streptomyces]|uniref:hypothetical protein n=1 Tax=unclassified Streptomyces TaxID=2593676 RepID=UPI002E803EE3|nr:hypothetical protein [Streptomyces sp. NBC_00589]WTI36744.1 hypothetical protein OIC96_17845 [Streptomyces sp. NBC_00775]WUB29579.1 hypothetical protein OHA51_31890 [Streptomyces sp. NBC_00589]